MAAPWAEEMFAVEKDVRCSQALSATITGLAVERRLVENTVRAKLDSDQGSHADTADIHNQTAQHRWWFKKTKAVAPGDTPQPPDLLRGEAAARELPVGKRD